MQSSKLPSRDRIDSALASILPEGGGKPSYASPEITVHSPASYT